MLWLAILASIILPRLALAQVVDEPTSNDNAAVESAPSAAPTRGIGSAFGEQPFPSHDWRSSGFVAVVGGELYDPWCRPLRSVGSNVPNLLFRRGLRENLEWMRWHQMRWMRVIVTGHGHAGQPPEVASGAVEQRLAALLREVEAFNAAHDPRESIYVLVSLTDYYEPGVPGDRYGYDKPGWCLLRVLNAPWYRRGVQRYEFQEECGGVALQGAPNYEVYYKPWVQSIVAVGARSPAVLGWQLGNELKARNSPINGIADAYDWYLDWLGDMADTIRAIDRNHLIFAPAQYMAELTDLPYRPNETAIQRDRLAAYFERFGRMLRACAAHCWNVWSLTNYDFRHYAVDDAMLLEEAGVAAVVTEYGFTLGTGPEMVQRFAGDRRAALRSGVPRSWEDLAGVWQPHDWGALELVRRAGLDGIAPWGSPNPDPSTDPWLDLDGARGIAHAPEGDELWDIWHQIAAELETANRQAGLSATCQAFTST